MGFICNEPRNLLKACYDYFMEHVPNRHPEVKDPAGHIKVAVSEFTNSSRFYAALFEDLGYSQISDKPAGAAWVTPDGFGIWIAQAEVPDYVYTHSSPGLHHLCLKAESPELINAIYARLVEEEAHIFNPPQYYPQYTDNYYAMFFADPDGIKLEVAHY